MGLHNVDEYEEDEEELSIPFNATNIECRYCGEHILFDDYVDVISPVRSNIVGGEITWSCPEYVDEAGTEQFPSFILHDECFRSMWDSIQDATADIPYRRKGGLECRGCGNNIQNDELHILIQPASVGLSKKQPNGYAEASLVFFKDTESDFINTAWCMRCMAIEGSEFDEWESLLDLFTQDEEEENEFS